MVATKKCLSIVKGLHTLPTSAERPRNDWHVRGDHGRHEWVGTMAHMAHELSRDRNLVEGGRGTGEDDARYDLPQYESAVRV